ncbi:hypothetical protein OGAPHI_002094 [Ogataea philodendri]|uniref:FMN hydroxy acid dehydrogenase domain-containing protein n=1 Tax=Ogataea philodendri TaxID=1378263 RepID=A0A9P8PAT0_9ASCO|nr:uncharacterized protein OGAPHI_002094 [Ogataea philodendri]KAH3668340.1 hypothetical protein OGAPHI_002094 [Ogataea philodendri]
MFSRAFSRHYRATVLRWAVPVSGVALGTTLLATYSKPVFNDTRRKKRIVFLDDEEDDDEDLEEKRERERQEAIANKPPLSSIFSLTDFETIAKKVLPYGIWGYYSTGSDDEISLRENHYAYGRIFFRPQCLMDVSECSLETEMLGTKVSAPFYITAFAGSPSANPLAERALRNAAGLENIIHLVPFQLSFPVAEYGAGVLPSQQNFYQLHFYTQKQFDEAPQFLEQLKKDLPSVRAVFINVDLAALGNREKDFKIRASLDPDSASDVEGYAAQDAKYFTVTWDHIKKIKESTDLPIVLKGVLNKNDVLKAAEAGLAGALISSHGGRQLDFAMPTIEILAESKQLLKEKGLDKNFELFIDGGIRRGSDIIKALCLGASGVGLGRPFLYSLASYGEPGVQKAIQILKKEMIRDMQLLGVTSISQLNEDMVDITSLKYKGLQVRDSLYDQNYTEMPGPVFKTE